MRQTLHFLLDAIVRQAQSEQMVQPGGALDALACALQTLAESRQLFADIVRRLLQAGNVDACILNVLALDEVFLPRQRSR